MKIYKHDKRFAADVLSNGWIGVFVRDYDGKYKLNYQLIDYCAAYQCIWSLTGKKKVVRDEDFEEVE